MSLVCLANCTLVLGDFNLGRLRKIYQESPAPPAPAPSPGPSPAPEPSPSPPPPQPSECCFCKVTNLHLDVDSIPKACRGWMEAVLTVFEADRSFFLSFFFVLFRLLRRVVAGTQVQGSTAWGFMCVDILLLRMAVDRLLVKRAILCTAVHAWQCKQ